MFRVQDNVPEIYINESRDFQLVSRLYDLLFSGVKYDIDTMVNVLDATLAKDSVLQLMCTKIGFFPRIEIDANVLKYIIASFPYIIKNKGNKLGIQYAVNAILKSESNPSSTGKPHIEIINKLQQEDATLQEYTVYIYTTVSLFNRAALEEVLRYVLPIGSTYQILSYEKVFDGRDTPTMLSQQDTVTINKINPYFGSQIRNGYSVYKYNGDNNIVQTVNHSEINKQVDHIIGAYDGIIIYGSSDYDVSVAGESFAGKRVIKQEPQEIIGVDLNDGEQ